MTEPLTQDHCVHGVRHDDHCQACCPDCQADIAEMLSGYCECGAAHGMEEVDSGKCDACGGLL